MTRDYNLANDFDREQDVSELSQQIIRDCIVTATKIPPFFHCCDRQLPFLGLVTVLGEELTAPLLGQ